MDSRASESRAVWLEKVEPERESGKYMASIVDMLFGCWHKNYSFPITNKPGQRRSAAASLTGTYVVCLDCGKEFPYDWTTMKVLDSRPSREKALAAKAADSARAA
jgi:hypothetical protein